MTFITRCMIVSIYLAFAIRVDAQTDTKRLETITANVLASRLRVTSGHFEATLTASDSPGTGTEYRVWFDGDKTRIDRSVDNSATLWHRIAYVGDRFYAHEEAQGRQLAATMGKVNASDLARMSFFDPRALGLFTCPIEHLHAIDWVRQFPVVEPRAIEFSHERINDEDRLVVQYVSKIGQDVTLHFAPELDNALSYMECALNLGKDRIAHSIESHYDGDPLFPSRVVFTAKANGEVTSTETFSIRNLELLKPIPQEVFTFAAMNVPENTTVLEYPQNSEKYTSVWDGTKLDFSGHAHATGHRTVASRVSRYWAIAALGALVVAGGCYWLVKRK